MSADDPKESSEQSEEIMSDSDASSVEESTSENSAEAGLGSEIETAADEFLAAQEGLLDGLIDPEWEKTLERLGLEEADVTGVSLDDILYLAKRWQFLQVVDSGGDHKPYAKPKRIQAKSGWTIVDYGDAMSTSPGRYIFGRGYVPFYDDDEEGGGGAALFGKGTIIKQAFDSACEIIQLAQEAGWKGVQVVDGHPDMQRAAWVEAVRIGVRLEGYIPDVPAELVRRRIAMSEAEMESVRREVMNQAAG